MMSEAEFSKPGEDKISETHGAHVPDPRIHKAPRSWKIFIWLGPSFLWMLSAAGSGEVLFTPRIAALYGYSLLWALIAAVVLKWFINREVGRYTVCTGETVLSGFRKLPGPTNWAIWLILIPQLVVAVSTIAGMSGAAGDALSVIIGGDIVIITLLIIAVTGAIVLVGKYKVVERVASITGVVLSLSVMAAAFSIFPDPSMMLEGLVPRVTRDINYEEVLPWLGFMLAGAAGLLWYSNWVQARGYGSAGEAAKDFEVKHASEEEQHRLKNWIGQMTISNTLAVIGAVIIAIAFLILGAELLRPEGLVPKEGQMSEVLGRLLGGVWGDIGFWFMISAVFVTFWTTALTNQDGWGRMFATGSKIIFRQFSWNNSWSAEERLRKVYIIVVLVFLPIVLYISFGKPVELLKIAGGIEAAHIPIVAGLTLYLNWKELPKSLRPSAFTLIATALAGLFFAFFAVFYIVQLMSTSGN